MRNKGKRTRPVSFSAERQSIAASVHVAVSAAALFGLIIGGSISGGGLVVADAGADFNPFAAGCLRSKLGAEWRVRV